jgi:hypothetical protein
VPGESDVDIVFVSAERVTGHVKASVVEHLLDLSGACPARGLEFTLYKREVAASVPHDADCEVNVNGGPRMSSSIHLDARKEPGFWVRPRPCDRAPVRRRDHWPSAQ